MQTFGIKLAFDQKAFRECRNKIYKLKEVQIESHEMDGDITVFL